MNPNKIEHFLLNERRTACNKRNVHICAYFSKLILLFSPAWYWLFSQKVVHIIWIGSNIEQRKILFNFKWILNTDLSIIYAPINCQHFTMPNKLIAFTVSLRKIFIWRFSTNSGKIFEFFENILAKFVWAFCEYFGCYLSSKLTIS